MSVRIVFCALLVALASAPAMAAPAMAANDSSPNTVPVQPQVGQDVQPAAPACRQAKAQSQAKSANRPQLTAEERAQRKALRAQRAALGAAPVAKPRTARLPLC